ncbi:MAG: RrF2 family transcriptional regulator [Gemmatimonadota bacterium]
MQLTRESEHAIEGLKFLAGRPPGEATPLAEIARQQGLPLSFLSKIFQKLARHDVVKAARGRGHGYHLSKPAASISILDVLVAVEGPRLLNRCLLWQSRCHDDDPCPLHDFLKDRAAAMEEALRGITLADLAPVGPSDGRK